MKASQKLSFFLIVLLVSSFIVVLFSFQNVAATVIFSDDFEGGDLTNWSTVTAGSGTIAISSEQANGGTYSAKATGTTGGDRGYVYKSFTDSTTVYVQFYTRFAALPSGYAATDITSLRDGSGGRQYFDLYNDGDTLKFALQTFIAGTPTWTYVDDVTPTINTWYCIKQKFVAGSSTGESHLWVDGVEKVSLTELNVGAEAVNLLRLGLAYLGTSDSVSLYVDDVIISNSDIVPPTVYYPYIQQVSDIDSTADIGTHSNFTAQQYGPNQNNDTLLETTTLYNVTLETQDFEGAYPPSGWTESPSNSKWAQDTSQKHSGTYSAGYEYAAGMVVGDLVSPSYNLTGATALYLSFYYFDDDCDLNEVTYDYLDNGAAWDNIGNLASSTEDTFDNLISVKITDAQYLHGAFQFMIDGATIGSGENFYVDDFTVIAEYNNYTLALEEQFTEIPTDFNSRELCVYGGNWTTEETLNVEGWNVANSSWTTIGALTSNQWNNYSVADWINSSATEFYIRFVDGAQTSDAVQDSWSLDAVLMRVYNSTAVAYYLTLVCDFEADLSLHNQAGYGNVLTAETVETLSFQSQSDYGTVHSAEAEFTLTTEHKAIYNNVLVAEASFSLNTVYSALLTFLTGLACSFTLTFLSSSIFNLMLSAASTFSLTFLASLTLAPVLYIVDLTLSFQATLTSQFLTVYHALSALQATFNLTSLQTLILNVISSLSATFNLTANFASIYQVLTSLAASFSLNILSERIIGAVMYIVTLSLSYSATLTISLTIAWNMLSGLTASFNLNFLSSTLYNLLLSISGVFTLNSLLGLTLAPVLYIVELGLSFQAVLTSQFLSVFNVLSSLQATFSLSSFSSLIINVVSSLLATFNVAGGFSSIYHVLSGLAASFSLSFLSEQFAGAIAYFVVLTLSYSATLTNGSSSIFNIFNVLSATFSLSTLTGAVYNLVSSLTALFSLNLYMSLLHGIVVHVVTLTVGFTATLTTGINSMFNLIVGLAGNFNLGLLLSGLHENVLYIVTLGLSWAASLQVSFISGVTGFVVLALEAVFGLNFGFGIAEAFSAEEWFVVGLVVSAIIVGSLFLALFMSRKND